RAALPDTGLSFELRGEPAQPGSVLTIAVRTTRDVEGVSATAFGQTATLIRDPSARVWRGLIGVDVAATATSSLVVTAHLPGGGSVLTTSPLTLIPRHFPTRRLTVA